MSTISLASSPADSQALEAIERHHAELVGAFAVRVSALAAAVRGGTGWQQARDDLVAWCRRELLPHARAEEVALYPAAKRLGELDALVRAMSHEHALLDDLVARLERADDAPAALLQAGAGQALFESHVAKENELLLPAVVADPNVAVADLLDEMHGVIERDQGAEVPASAATSGSPHVGHACGCHDEPAETPELDARAIPHAVRHATIFGALDAIAPGADLILVAPHDPLPLLAQLEQRAPGAFAVDYLQRGPDAWRLRLSRSSV